MKTCRKCELVRPLTEYYTGSARCKSCISKSNKERRETDPVYRQTRIDQGVQWNRDNPLRVMIRNAKTRAKERGLPCTVKVEDIVVPEFCPVLGVKLEFHTGRVQANSPTLDRKDNSFGYTPENVWVISQKANAMKNNATADDLRVFAEWIRSEYGTEEDSVI